MTYRVSFNITFFNGSSILEVKKFETKGKGKKVLRAHIKKYVEQFFSMPERTENVNVLSIEKFETINFNNVWPKEDYKKFTDKLIK